MATFQQRGIVLPPHFIIVRILEFIFALVALPIAILIYTQRDTQPYEYHGPLRIIASASITVLVTIYLILTSLSAPKFARRTPSPLILLLIDILFVALWIYTFLVSTGTRHSGRGCVMRDLTGSGDYEVWCPEINNEAMWRATSLLGWVLIGVCGAAMCVWFAGFVVVAVGCWKGRRERGENRGESGGEPYRVEQRMERWG